MQEAAAKTRKSKDRTVRIVVLGGGFLMLCCSGLMSLGDWAAKKNREEAQAQHMVDVEAAEAERVRKLERVRANVPEFERMIDTALENQNANLANFNLNTIIEAIPDYSRTKEYREKIDLVRARVLVKTRMTTIEQGLEQAKGKIKIKEYLEAENLLDDVINAAADLPEEALTEQIKAWIVEAEKLKSRHTKSADKMRAQLAKKQQEAAEQQRRCGVEGGCIEVTANTLCSKYTSNEVRADEAYKGRALLVTGRVDDISKDMFDNININLSSSYKCLTVSASLADGEAPTASKLNSGNRVTVRCLGGGMVINSPQLRHCEIVEYWQ